MTALSPFYTDTHVSDSLSYLLAQFKRPVSGRLNDGLRLHGILTAFANRVQEVEEAITSLYYYSMLDNAVGIPLDTIGTIAGESRVYGESDADYRVRIKLRIILNSSVGNTETIIKALNQYTLLSPLLIIEYGATVFIRIDTAHVFTETELQDIQRAAPIGVTVVLISYDDSTVFELGSGTSSIADLVHGLGSGVTSVNTGSGGRMSTLIM